nr:hypothetical protein [Tanacetum cinerariifolium]
MKVPDAMINDAIKKKTGYKYYMAKKIESEKAKIVDKPEEEHVSLIKSKRGKGFICYGDQVANVPNKLKKDNVPRKTRSLTIAEEVVIGELANSINIQELRSERRQRSQLKIDSQTDKAIEWGQKLEGPIVDDPTVQSLLDLRKGSKSSRLESLRQKKQPVLGEGSKESANETYDADESNMDLSNDNPNVDDDAVKYGVFMRNNSIATPNSTYLSLMVTSFLLDFIQTLLDEKPKNELTGFMIHPVYTDAQTTLVVHNLEENSELKIYISGASEVPLGIHVDVLATKILMHEMFPDENAHHILSPPAKKIPYHTTTPQPNSLQAAKKLDQERNTRPKLNWLESFAKLAQGVLLDCKGGNLFSL